MSSSYLSPDIDGWHGLAWLEALLRLADHRASEKPSCAALMMQAAMMLSAQSFAVRDNRRTFLPEFSVAELNSNLVGALTRLAHAPPALALGGSAAGAALEVASNVRLVPAPPTDVPQTDSSPTGPTTQVG